METSKSEVNKSKITYDRDGIPIDDPELRGLARYFNNCTIRGRSNVGKATVAAFFGIYLYRKFSNFGAVSSSKMDEVKPKETEYDEVRSNV